MTILIHFLNLEFFCFFGTLSKKLVMAYLYYKKDLFWHGENNYFHIHIGDLGLSPRRTIIG